MGDAAMDEGPRILVVEDNEDFRLLVELILVDEGYRVDTASCAEDAIRLLNTRDYQLVLTDYSLPVHSGAWLLSQATARSQRCELPFVIITGDPDAPGIPRDALVIRKPIDFDQLLGEVRRMLADVGQPIAVGVPAR
jgi:CheY-like chemotaxis protein